MGEDAETGYNTTDPSKIKDKGGFRATAFIYALVGLDNMGFVALMVSLVLYFWHVMLFDLATSANTLTNLLGSTFLLTVVGAFISDTYINRFHTVLIFGTLQVSAMALMTLQAHSSSLLPKPNCKSNCVEGGMAVYFYITLSLLALGAGGVRGALPALGADQFDVKDPKEVKELASYFNWFILSTVTGSAVGVTLIIWVATNKNGHGWWKAFLITTVGGFVGYVILFCGKSFYRLQLPKDSPFVRIAQVFVVAIKNRGLSHPDSPSELYEDSESKTTTIVHTEQFRFLDKAAILAPDTEPAPWTICTVTQLEEVKILIRMLPIIFSTVIMNTCMAQLQTFSVEQGYRMNPKLGSIKIPSASIPVIPLVFMIILLPIYDKLFVPFARSITKHPSGITQLQRVGVGLVLSILSMSIAALVEVRRRNASIKNVMQPISLFWLAFQYGIFGIADMFTLVGLLDFFYKEAPAGMKSLSTSFTWISLSLGYFLSSVLVNVINGVTSRVTPSRQGWLHGMDLDKNNLNLFYWFMAILSVLNFFNYLYWAMWYTYKTDNDDVELVKASSTPASQSPVSTAPFFKATSDGATELADKNEPKAIIVDSTVDESNVKTEGGEK